ncbi:response regulator transcription factor [Actinoallomurus rhizosphaericola]|uniref:response regulator transcription factor n=1 Tax=Actinoallomurus rhizosphaericola TaxID=2952536 RepID=UPI002092A701|nr:response regulator transcription factor [Actinoallomurus rhizosphaericola]MCO5998228.1 response regulator transcription factor [Actinoallomurus rhizosphaericola]
MAEAESRDASRARLLLVEDDDELSEMLVRLFTEEGYSVELARDGQRGLHLGLSRPYDAMIIDRGLPVLDGLDLLVRLRRRAVVTPVLVLTALGAVADRVAGLDAGAEDYLVKPFEIDELLARVRALRRRNRDSAQVLPLGAGRFDLATRVVTLPDGAQVTLSGREYELLRVLTSRPDQVHTRAVLRERVFDAAPAESIVDTYVYYLRTKLGRTVIRTVRGVGYRAGEL